MKKFVPWGRYGVFLFFLLSLYFLYGNAIFIVLFVLMLCFIPVSRHISRKIFDSLSLSMESGLISGKTGDFISLEIYAHHDTLFPLLDTTISYTLSSGFYPCEETFEVVCPVIGSKTRNRVFLQNLEFVGCGSYFFKITKVKAYDYLHIFSFEKEFEVMEKDGRINIYPIPVSVIDEEVYVQQEGFDEIEQPEKKGNVSSNVTDVREFIQGDRLQKVHWKLSAKVGKWMVKENESAASERYVILPELTHHDAYSKDLEKTMSFLYGLCLKCLEKNMEFDVMVYQKDVCDFDVIHLKNEEDIIGMFDRIFFSKTYEIPGEGLMVLERAGIFHGEIVHITEEGIGVETLE